MNEANAAAERESGDARKPDHKDLQSVWEKSEDVAIHFNDLIMRWRLQAVGGLAAITTLAGFVVGDADTFRDRYKAMLMLSLFLACAWVGVAVLDLFYYRLLLLGSVRSIRKLEDQLPHIQLSTDIDLVAGKGAKVAPWIFYALGLFPLLVLMAWAGWRLTALTDGELDRVRKLSSEPAMFRPLPEPAP